MNVLKKAGNRLVSRVDNEMSLEEFLTKCKSNSLMYATASERLLHAIGEVDKVDTRKDDRLSRIFRNETISTYPSFRDIYGLEHTLQDLVSFVKHAAQGLEERKQILYLLGPVGSSKSSIVRIIKKLMESVPFYAIKDSPVFDNPLSLFTPDDSEELGIPARYFGTIPSPWLIKRLKEVKGDLSKFNVVRIHPSEAHQIAISHIEPGDENNQDISSLVGKLNIRELDKYAQNDPDAYSYSGGLCLGNRGIAEFAEMFKSPIKSLNPLLEATQSGFYKGTESISAIPFEGIIIAHSNESEWQKFRNDKRNEALIDRIFIVRVPYCLRYQEEAKIYEKMLNESSLSSSPLAPQTLEIMAKFSVMSRFFPSKFSTRESKMKIYNGENLKHKNPDARSVKEYRTEAHESGFDEGFSGISTRFAFKIIAQAFNYDPEEIAANPVHLMLILEERIKGEHLSKEEENTLIEILSILYRDYQKNIGNEIRKAYVESYETYGQTLFDNYIHYCDFWLDEKDCKNIDTGLSMTPQEIEKYLEEIEIAAEIPNKKDFRNEVVKYCFKYRAAHNGENPKWTSYNKIRDVLEAKIFANLDEMLPIISSANQATEEEKQQHNKFVDRMTKQGYTRKQVQLLVDWYVRSSKE